MAHLAASGPCDPVEDPSSALALALVLAEVQGGAVLGRRGDLWGSVLEPEQGSSVVCQILSKYNMTLRHDVSRARHVKC